MDSMIADELPRPDADLDWDAPCSVFGWPTFVTCAPSFPGHWPAHLGPLSIKCAFGGREWYRTDQGVQCVDDARYLVLNEGQEYESWIDEGDEITSFCLFFNGNFARDVLHASCNDDDHLLDEPAAPSLQLPQFFDQVQRHESILSPWLLDLYGQVGMRSAPVGAIEERMHLVLEKLLQAHRGLLRRVQSLPSIRRNTRVEIYRRLHLARTYLEDHYAADLTLPRIASAACLSPHHFLRLFKASYDCTPHQYLIGFRLQRACDLLRSTDETVSNICFDVGFASVSSFCNLFKRRMGVSPEQYRLNAAGRRKLVGVSLSARTRGATVN